MYMYNTYWFDNSPIRLSYWTRSASRSRALSLRSFSIIAICSKWHFSCSFNWFSNAKISSLALSTVRRIDANREGSCCEINYVCNIAVACTTVVSIYRCKKKVPSHLVHLMKWRMWAPKNYQNEEFMLHFSNKIMWSKCLRTFFKIWNWSK